MRESGVDQACGEIERVGEGGLREDEGACQDSEEQAGVEAGIGRWEEFV